MASRSPFPHPSLYPPTWEQLDELDALMQRMLALPIDPPEEPVSPTPRAGELASVMDEHMAQKITTSNEIGIEKQTDESPDLSHPGTFPEVAEVAISELPSVPRFVPLGTDLTSPSALAIQQEPAQSLFSGPSSPASSPPPPEPPGEHSPASNNSPGPLRPLLWLNWCFCTLMRPLGPLGRVLSGDIGLWLLGLTGLAMLAAAVMLAALELGWIW
jgi:hypothetical protein